MMKEENYCNFAKQFDVLLNICIKKAEQKMKTEKIAFGDLVDTGFINLESIHFDETGARLTYFDIKNTSRHEDPIFISKKEMFVESIQYDEFIKVYNETSKICCERTAQMLNARKLFVNSNHLSSINFGLSTAFTAFPAPSDYLFKTAKECLDVKYICMSNGEWNLYLKETYKDGI